MKKESAGQCIIIDGTLYFLYGNTRIKVTEHFAENGKTVVDLLEDVILYEAKCA